MAQVNGTINGRPQAGDGLEAQIALPVEARLPIDPLSLVDLEPIERGGLYNAVDLDSEQRGCVEEGCRLALAGLYGRCGGDGVADHMAREKAASAALGRPSR